MAQYELSKHVQRELVGRRIPLTVIEAIMDAPEQKIPETSNVLCYQSRVEISGKLFLVRVMVNETLTPPKVITAYRTTRIAKYWKETP